MTQRTIQKHKKLHAALLELIEAWKGCEQVPGFKRTTSRRTIQSLVEWSKKQTINPDTPLV